MGFAEQSHGRAERFVNAGQLAAAIQCPGQPQCPSLDYSASKRALQVRMVRGVTAIAQRNQVGRFVYSAGGTRDQVVIVSFAPGAFFAASSARVRVSSENDGANGAPLLKRRLGRRMPRSR